MLVEVGVYSGYYWCCFGVGYDSAWVCISFHISTITGIYIATFMHSSSYILFIAHILYHFYYHLY